MLSLSPRFATLALFAIVVASSALAEHVDSPPNCKRYVRNGLEKNSTIAFATLDEHKYVTVKQYKGKPIFQADYNVDVGLTLSARGPQKFVLGVEYTDINGPKGTVYFEPSKGKPLCFVKNSQKWNSIDGIHLMEVKSKSIDKRESTSVDDSPNNNRNGKTTVVQTCPNADLLDGEEAGDMGTGYYFNKMKNKYESSIKATKKTGSSLLLLPSMLSTRVSLLLRPHATGMKKRLKLHTPKTERNMALLTLRRFQGSNVLSSIQKRGQA
jgi:hypothetical protein